MAIQTNTPADAVAAFLESRGFSDDTTVIRVGPETSEDWLICCTDYSSRKDGVLQKTGEELTAPRVQVRVRQEDYPTAFLKIEEIAFALSALKQQDLFIVDFPKGAYLLACFSIISGPMYMGRDPKPGQLENFSLNGEVTLIPFSST